MTNITSPLLLNVIKRCKEATVATIIRALQTSPPTQNNVCWLLLEYTYEYPFPPTLGLACPEDTQPESYHGEHPLVPYNAADLALFSESGTIHIDFSKHEALFDTANELMEDMNPRESESIAFEAYLDICRTLMADPALRQLLNTTPGFHVTARDFELCNEEAFLKQLLPKAARQQLENDISQYEQKLEAAYEQDEVIQHVNAVTKKEARQYASLLSNKELEKCNDVYAGEEICFIQPFYVEINYHKRPEEMTPELSAQPPDNAFSYYHYKFLNNQPQIVDFYMEQQLIWRKIFTHTEKNSTVHQFFLKNGHPELEQYACCTTNDTHNTMTYRNYMHGHFEEITYIKNKHKQVEQATLQHTMFDTGFKLDSTLTYFFSFDQNELFRIISEDENGEQTVAFCRDDSFMEDAIRSFAERVSTHIFETAATYSPQSGDTIIMSFCDGLPFYFTITLVQGDGQTNLPISALYEPVKPMMNLTTYTSTLSGQSTYFPKEKALAYIDEAHARVCRATSEAFLSRSGVHIEVLCREES